MSQTEKVNILLVDDRPENLKALEASLEDLDLNIVKATSGNEALSLMLENDFALVLLDVQMPDMNGFETAEIMRESEGTKNVPIVFVTAISKEQKYVFKGYNTGAVDYLFKPLDPEILKSKVKVFINLHKQKKALGNTALKLKKANKALQLEIIERKRAEKEKHKVQSQLQQAQKMKSIGTLAGGIAHNFNNLLMGIQGNVSIMLLDIDSSNPRHKNLMNIEKLVENGAKLTSQLVGYAREGSYEVKPISLNQLVKETSDIFGMTKKEITVHQKLYEKLYGIKADQGQIEQVLLNLYVNAADAMPGGGDLFLKTINVTDKDMTGKPYEVKPGNYVLLTVRDTGIGMDKETKERIFDPFFTTKGLASGTGLGLASAYGIIKGHGGYIDVDSKIGEGTSFSICLPATEKKIKEKKVLSDKLVMGKGVVLLVDDEEMVLETSEVLLKHLGYDALLAKNGQVALELYKQHQDMIDMVLLDMVMPVMGGGEAFNRMKEINNNVKVLLSSGYSFEGEAKEILKRGCDAFIQKPFKMEQLSQKISHILDER